MTNNTVYQFVCSNLGVKIFLKRVLQKNGALKWKIEASLYTLYWCFKKFPFTLYTYVLAKILQKLHEEFWQLHTKNEKSKKLKFDGLFLPKKYMPSAKKLYIEDLSKITFNYCCENSLNYLFHFWNQRPFFTTQLFCIFLSSGIIFFLQK